MKVNCVINLAGLLDYEKFSGKKFFNISEAEDYLMLSWCVFRQSNPEIPATYDEYKGMLENKRFLYEYFNKFQRACDELNFGENGNNDNSGKTNEDVSVEQIVDILVVKIGLDMDYVLHRLPLYLIGGICTTFYDAEIERLQENRMSHFFQILPILGFSKNNKIKAPEDLYPLPGEKSKHERKQEELMKMRESLRGLFGKKTDNEESSINKEE